ncbi:YjbQ family protein [Lacrimispora sp.]|uniref:YjbQ family protein n=1 Tax=Lacrimispora sp. TaxID=2719234 RepID=UPI0028AE73E3|nr:YjbQ family protein [Lacrimispora sp.]
MSVYREVIGLTSHGCTPTYINITDWVREIIARSGIKDGIVSVISPHTTCSVFFQEFVHDKTEDGTEFLQVDLNRVLDKIIPDQTSLPPEGEYMYPGPEHFDEVFSWPDAESYLPGMDKLQLLNADAHLKATILGSSQVFPVEDGSLGLSVTGYIYFVDFDRMRARTRKCKVVVMGD